MSGIPTTEKYAHRIAGACAVLGGLASLMAVLARVLSRYSEWVSSFVRPYFSIALPTACLLTIFCAALIVYNIWPHRRGSRIFGWVVIIPIIGTSLLALARLWLPVHIPFENWLVNLLAPASPVHIGRLSPHTAATFLCAALAFGCVLSSRLSKTWQSRLACGLAALAFASSTIAALGFAVGTPWIYGYQGPSMMWLASMIFIALTTGLMLEAYPKNWLLDGLVGKAEDTAGAASLRYGRSLVVALLVLISGIGTAGFYFLKTEQANLRARVEQELAAIADLKVAQIVDWRRERLQAATLLLYTPYAARRAMDALSRPNDVMTQRMFTNWLADFMATGAYDEALLVDSKLSALMVYPSRAVRGLSQAELGPTEKAFGKHNVFRSDLHRSELDGVIRLSTMVPLTTRRALSSNKESIGEPNYDVEIQVVGVMVLRTDARRSLFPLIHEWATASKTAEMFLVGREGNNALYLSELRYFTNAAFQLRSSVSHNEPVAIGALRGERIIRGRDYRNVPVLAVTRRIPETPWTLVAKVDEQEIYAPVRERGLTVGLVVAVLILGLAGGFNLLWRRRDVEFMARQMQIERDHFVLAQRLAHLMRHAHDVIIITDDEWRILEVNDRGLKEYGYTLAELRQMRAPDLRSSTAREDFPAMAESFQKSGFAVLETEHRRKDGSTFPVEISNRRVELSGVNQTLAIIRDITERKRVEEEIRQLNLSLEQRVEERTAELKAATAALRESEARHRAVFQGAPHGILVADIRNKSFHFANPAICHMFGYSADELTCLSVADLHPAERLEEVIAAFERHAQGDGIPARNMPCRRKDGSVFLADIASTPMVIGEEELLIGFFTEVTERASAEKARDDTLLLLQSVLDSSVDMIFVKDLKLRTVLCNAAFSRAVGKQPPELYGKTDIENGWDPELVNGNPAKNIRGYVKDDRAALRGEVVRNICDPANIGQEIRVFDTIKLPLRDRNGDITGVLGVSRDITERGRAEAEIRRLNESLELRVKERTAQLEEANEQLRNSALRLKQIAKAGNVGLWDWDVKTNKVFFSPEWKRQIGYDDHEISNEFEEWQSRVHTDDLQATLIKVRESLLSPFPNYQVEFRFRHKDGSYRWILAQASVMLGADGHPQRMLGSHVDITELKHLQQQLLEVSDREQARIGQDLHDGLGQLLVSAAFDLGQLERRLAPTAPAESALAQQAGEVVDAAITEARGVARGLLAVQLGGEGLSQALRDLATSVTARYHIACNAECPKEVSVENHTVANHLFRIAQEAVNNAVKHAKARHISIQLAVKPADIELTVSDDGVGLNLVADHGGMGLQIMDYRARALNGSLKIERARARGTRILCSVPRNPS